MFPVRDSLRVRRPAVITWLTIGATCLAFVYQLSLDPERMSELIYLCGIVPARWFVPDWANSLGFPPHDYWPFLTSLFLHGGWLHLVSNMWALWIFGDNVEDRLGHVRFLVLYVACGLAAGVLHAATNPYSRVPTIGASGAIAGVMGAYLVLYPRSRVVAMVPVACFPLFFELPAVVYLGVWFVLQFASGFFALTSGTNAEGIAWWAHVGGFLAGILMLRILGERRRRPLDVETR